MATSALVLHRGAQPVTAEQLREYRAPPPAGRWYPLAHARVADTVKSTLTEAGYEVRREQYGVMRDGSRFFGTLDLGTPLVSGVTLAVGIRNSVDRSFPLGFCAGQRVFCVRQPGLPKRSSRQPQTHRQWREAFRAGHSVGRWDASVVQR